MSFQYQYDLEDLDEFSGHSTKIRHNRIHSKWKTSPSPQGSLKIQQEMDPLSNDRYHYSYKASRYEKQWLFNSIAEMEEQNWIEDILMMVKGGKEATVYLCSTPEQADVPYLAAKVYRPRRFRNLKDDHLYREGREHLDATGKIIKNHGSQHAMDKRTDYGLKLLHSSWIGHEFLTMKLLEKAGVDIPKPYASSDNVILMEYLGNELIAAPTLNTVSLTSTEAAGLFERVIFDIELMLRANRVHADLSAYNILYWRGEIKLIDFPQAIDPDENHNAYRIFSRDVARICSYFSSQGVKTDPQGVTTRLWKEKGKLTYPDLDPHYLDPENEDDVRLWKAGGR